MEQLLNKLSIIAKTHLHPYGTHGFEHTARVTDLCRIIGEKRNADLDVLLPAAILHDIGSGNENHASVGARMAKKELEELNIKAPKIERICNAIATHSFSGGKEPQSHEAKILSDVDKLDALGAIGIYRAAMYSGEHLRSYEEFIDHFHEKLLKLQSIMFTEEARKIAKDRTSYMQSYLLQLDKELKQEL